MRSFPVIVISAILVAFPVQVLTQDGNARDEADSDYRKLEKAFREAAGPDLRFINGYEYTDRFPGTRGTPFFPSDIWYIGDLYMNGKSYTGLALRYDIFRDQLIYNHILTTGNYMVVLNKTRVDSFIIDGRQFCKLEIPRGSMGEKKEAYYEVLSTGRASLFVKWSARLSEPSPGSNGEFSRFSEWYILNQGRFIRVYRRAGILNALEDKEKEIRNFIRENKIIVKPGNEDDIRRIVDHYNRLSP